jgi:hypothetical protein
MSNVFANGREISAKTDANKSICAMPDVCLSPPSPPAGPVPIPYPNTATASDTDQGSKTVKVGGDEVGLKNKSDYKKSSGDEAATKSLGMGVVSHNIQGPMQHAAWSMDVKIEGENAIRHMDLTTHNHSNPTNGAVILNKANQKIDSGKPLNCEELQAKNTDMQKNDLRNSAGSRNYTATTASYTPPEGPSSFKAAMSRQSLISSGSDTKFAESRPPDQAIGCSDHEYGFMKNNHTEPKLMEEIFSGAGGAGGPAGSLGTLTMNINYVKVGKKPTNWICDSCIDGICMAIECGLDIELCENGKKVSAEQVKKRCESGKGWVG